MEALIELSLRAVFLALAFPLTRGLFCVLVALYGAGSAWPGWVTGLCAALGLGFWLTPLWRLWQDRRRRLRSTERAGADAPGSS